MELLQTRTETRTIEEIDHISGEKVNNSRISKYWVVKYEDKQYTRILDSENGISWSNTAKGLTNESDSMWMISAIKPYRIPEMPKNKLTEKDLENYFTQMLREKKLERIV